MITSNKKTRDVATPYFAQSYDGQYFDGITLEALDDATLVSTTRLLSIIRCCTPYGTNLVEAHLNLTMTCSTALTAKIAIGRFDTDGITAIETYNQIDIDQQHAFLTGSSSPISSSGGILFIDGLNIFPKIPKKTDSDFNEDGFVLLIQFSRVRTGTDVLKKFEVACSSLMGLI